MSRWASAAACALLALGLLPAVAARAEGFRVQPPQVESRVLRAEAERLRRMGMLEDAVAALNEVSKRLQAEKEETLIQNVIK